VDEGEQEQRGKRRPPAAAGTIVQRTQRTRHASLQQ
jgi:hypothetical protein